MSIIEKFLEINEILTKTQEGSNILNKIKNKFFRIKDDFLNNFSNFTTLNMLEKFKYIFIFLNDNLSKYGVIPVILSVIIYFMGFVSKCLKCEPIRIIILSIVVFITQGLSLYKEIEKKCPGKTKMKLKIFFKYLSMVTSLFIFGYLFLSYFFLTGIGRILVVIGPGKIIIPTLVGSIVMVTTNKIILVNKLLEEICEEK